MTTGTHPRFYPVDLSLQRYNPAMRKIWPWPMMLLEKVAEWINDLPVNTWLDAACGDGQLADMVDAERCVIGLDIEPIRLQRARNHPYHLLLRGSVTHLPLADKSLGGIVSVETLEHVEEVSSALREFSRCIKSQGYLLVTMPSVTIRSLWEMHRFQAPVYCDAEQHVRELSPIAIAGFQHRFQTFKWFERELRDCGFVVERKWGVGFLFPMWGGWLSWLEHGLNLLYREKINKLFAHLPVIRRYAFYSMYLTRLAEV